MPLEVLERRMRPGEWSDGGFLGATERLCEVLAADRRTLTGLGLSPEQLAQPLQVLFKAGMFAVPLHLGPEPVWDRLRAESNRWLDAARQRFGSVEYDGEHVLVGDRFLVEVAISCGSQECPWGGRGSAAARADERGAMCAIGSGEWRIENRRHQLELRGPELITHLISAHGFFEGFQSPYRVDPAALAELLELGPHRS